MRNTLILILSSLCALNILAGVFPASVEPRSIESALEPARESTGTVQRWHMFQTIPNLRDFEMRIVASDAAGGERQFGPELPGLKHFEARRRIRSYYTFARMFDGGGGMQRGYIKRVAAALREADPQLVEFSICLDLHYIRHLFHIRKDGKLTEVVPTVFGPFAIDDELAR